MASKLFCTVSLCLALFISVGHAQQSERSRPLEIGDPMPDYGLTTLINHPTGSARLTDFKGKILVLDFWSTGCSSCIASWPKLLALQHEFKDRLQIVLVNTYENEAMVRGVLNRQKEINGIEMDLPIVCRDTMLGKHLFPHQGVPYVVWANPEGVIVALSRGDALHRENIQAMIDGNPIDYVPVITKFRSIDYKKPLFIGGNGGIGNSVLHQSQLSRYERDMLAVRMTMPHRDHQYITLEEFTKFGYASEQRDRCEYGSVDRDAVDKAVVTLCGLSLEHLLAYAYDPHFGDVPREFLGYLHPSRIEFRGADKGGYGQRDSLGRIRYENLYTYQLVTSTASMETLQIMLQDDICRYFNLEVSWEKQPIRCLVVKRRKGHADVSLTNDGKTAGDNRGFVIEKMSVDFLLRFLQVHYYGDSPYPLLDETGLEEPIRNVKLDPTVLGDPASLDRILSRYGLSITLDTREIDILVVNDRKR